MGKNIDIVSLVSLNFRKMNKKIIGIFLILIFLIFVFGMTVYVSGWKQALIGWGISIVATVILMLGLFLVETS